MDKGIATFVKNVFEMKDPDKTYILMTNKKVTEV